MEGVFFTPAGSLQSRTALRGGKLRQYIFHSVGLTHPPSWASFLGHYLSEATPRVGQGQLKL